MRTVLLATAAVVLLAVMSCPEVGEAKALPSEVEALLRGLETQQQAESQTSQNSKQDTDKLSYLDYVIAKIMNSNRQTGVAKTQEEGLKESDKMAAARKAQVQSYMDYVNAKLMDAEAKAQEEEKETKHDDDVPQGFGDEAPPPIDDKDDKDGDGGLMMGDSYLNKAHVEAISKLQNNEPNAALQAWTTMQAHKWPGAIVPFEIAPQTGPKMRDAIQAAIQEYAAKTCILFIPHNNERDYVIFKPSQSCSSAIGRQGGPQYIELSPSCEDMTVAIHEMMHALGRFHEHERADRDNYISVQWQNIEGGLTNMNFAKLPNGMADTLNKPYDYQSIMHYPATSDSINGLPSMLPLFPTNSLGAQPPLGTFSNLDLQHLNSVYSCPLPPPFGIPGLPPPPPPPPPPLVPLPPMPLPGPGLPPPVWPVPPPPLPMGPLPMGPLPPLPVGPLPPLLPQPMPLPGPIFPQPLPPPVWPWARRS